MTALYALLATWAAVLIGLGLLAVHYAWEQYGPASAARRLGGALLVGAAVAGVLA